jgi:hypothetical protein
MSRAGVGNPCVRWDEPANKGMHQTNTARAGTDAVFAGDPRCSTNWRRAPVDTGYGRTGLNGLGQRGLARPHKTGGTGFVRLNRVFPAEQGIHHLRADRKRRIRRQRAGPSGLAGLSGTGHGGATSSPVGWAGLG